MLEAKTRLQCRAQALASFQRLPVEVWSTVALKLDLEQRKAMAATSRVFRRAVAETYRAVQVDTASANLAWPGLNLAPFCCMEAVKVVLKSREAPRVPTGYSSELPAPEIKQCLIRLGLETLPELSSHGSRLLCIEDRKATTVSCKWLEKALSSERSPILSRFSEVALVRCCELDGGLADKMVSAVVDASSPPSLHHLASGCYRRLARLEVCLDGATDLPSPRGTQAVCCPALEDTLAKLSAQSLPALESLSLSCTAERTSALHVSVREEAVRGLDLPRLQSLAFSGISVTPASVARPLPQDFCWAALTGLQGLTSLSVKQIQLNNQRSRLTTLSCLPRLASLTLDSVEDCQGLAALERLTCLRASGSFFMARIASGLDQMTSLQQLHLRLINSSSPPNLKRLCQGSLSTLVSLEALHITGGYNLNGKTLSRLCRVTAEPLFSTLPRLTLVSFRDMESGNVDSMDWVREASTPLAVKSIAGKHCRVTFCHSRNCWECSDLCFQLTPPGEAKPGDPILAYEEGQRDTSDDDCWSCVSDEESDDYSIGSIYTEVGEENEGGAAEEDGELVEQDEVGEA